MRQLWASRYIVFFQIAGLAERRVARNDFAYIDALWRRWAPGFTPPPEHLAQVKRTLAASMPAPIAMYRAGGSPCPNSPLVPSLFIGGADDGCALPQPRPRAGRAVTAGYRAETWERSGHFPHLEHPRRAVDAVLGHITATKAPA